MPLAGVDLGYGTTVEVSENSGVSWFKLAGIQDVQIPFGEADEVEVTHMESPNRTREFIAGLRTTSDITIPGLYVAGSATDVKIKTLHGSGATILIRFGDVGNEETITFTGFVKNYTIDRPVDGPRTFEVALKVNAEVV